MAANFPKAILVQPRLPTRGCPAGDLLKRWRPFPSLHHV